MILFVQVPMMHTFVQTCFCQAHTFWQNQNFNKFVIDNNEDYYIVKSVDAEKFVMRLEKII